MFFFYIYINILVSTFCETKKVVECVFLDRSGELCYSHIKWYNLCHNSLTWSDKKIPSHWHIFIFTTHNSSCNIRYKLCHFMWHRHNYWSRTRLELFLSLVWFGVVQGWSFFVFWFGLGFSVELRSRVMSCRVSRKS